MNAMHMETKMNYFDVVCFFLTQKTDVLDDGDVYGSNRDLSQFCMLLFHVNIYLWKIGKYIEAAINSLNAVCCFFP